MRVVASHRPDSTCCTHRPASDRPKPSERTGADPSTHRQAGRRRDPGPHPEARHHPGGGDAEAGGRADRAAHRRARSSLEACGDPCDHRDREQPEADGAGTKPRAFR